MALARVPQRRLLHPKERLPLEAIAQGLPTLGDRLLVVREMVARGWDLRASQRCIARAAAGPLGGRTLLPSAGIGRLPDYQDERGWWRAEGLRRQQEGSGQEKAPARGHGGPGLEGQGAQRQGPRPGWTEALLLESARGRLSRLKHLWVDAGYEGRGKRWAEEAMGLSVEIVRKPPKPPP